LTINSNAITSAETVPQNPGVPLTLHRMVEVDIRQYGGRHTLQSARSSHSI
jgi:hypothetical protein